MNPFEMFLSKVCPGDLSDHAPGARLPLDRFTHYSGLRCRECYLAWQTIRRRRRANVVETLWPVPPHRVYHGPTVPAGKRLKVVRVRGYE